MAQTGGGILIHDDRGVRVHLQRGSRAERGQAAFHRLLDGFSLAGTERQQHEVTGLHDRANTLRDAVGGHLVDVVVEEARVVDAGLFGQGLDTSAGGQRGTGLVEADVAVGADAENLHVDAASGFDGAIIGRAGQRDFVAVFERSAVEYVAGHMDLGWVQAERFDHGTMDGRMIGLRMGQRQSDVFVKRETTHARNVNGLVLDDLGERLIGGQRAGTSGQAQHGVRLCFDQVRHATAVDFAGLGFVLDNDDFRHRFPPVPCGPPDASRCTAARLADNGNILVTSG